MLTHPCPNFNGGLTKPQLKLRMGEQLSYVDVIACPYSNPSTGLNNLITKWVIGRDTLSSAVAIPDGKDP